MKILIVDDRKEELYLLETLLKWSSYDVVPATNGAEALEKLRAEGVDMIIADILMPVMDGFQLCREVKGDEELKDIPFVFYTATYTDERDEELALKVGADKFIRKPMEPEEFINIIKGVIGDVEKGKIKPKKPALEEEKGVFKLYSERLVRKLEKKMLDLEREVTEHKQTEEALRESEGKYRSLTNDVLDSSAVGIFILDSDFRIVWVNQSLERYFDLRRSEIIGKDKRQLIRERIKDIFEAPESFAEKVLATYDNNTYIENFECHMLPDGEREERWLEHWSQPILSGLYAGGRIEHYYDITERKRAKDEIRRNYDTQTVINSLLRLSLEDIPLEKFLKRAVDLIFSIPWLTTKSMGCIYLVEDDPEALVMKAQSRLDEPRQKACAWVPFGRCLCGRAALAQQIQFADRLDDRQEIMYEGITSHGHYCVPILFTDRTLGVICMYLSEGHRRNQREEEFLTAVANALASIIMREQAEEEKEKIQAQLLQVQKMEAIGTLAGGVAHDFNNLLTAIQGHTELAMMRLNEDEPVYRDLKEVKRASVRAANLTRQLLLFSRRQPMEMTPLNLNETVEDMMKMVRRLIGEDIAVTTSMEEDLWTIKADPVNIEQVIMNLVVNARDAMPEGGEIVLRTENVHLDEDDCKAIIDARPGNFVCLSIADTGIGMDKETIERIFEPFFSTKGPGKGTGLGLSVVYGIIKQHEGWINVYSEPGQGATFRIYLPAVSVKPDTVDEQRVSLAEFQGRGERILLVEDDGAIRELSARILRENGYVPFSAANAEEALEIFERENRDFALVFSDIVLPDKGGLQLVDELLSHKPDLRVLLSSGYSNEKSQWQAVRESGFRFLQKPYDLPDFLRAIREVLEAE